MRLDGRFDRKRICTCVEYHNERTMRHSAAFGSPCCCDDKRHGGPASVLLSLERTVRAYASLYARKELCRTCSLQLIPD